MRVPPARCDRFAVPRQTVPIVLPVPSESTQHPARFDLLCFPSSPCAAHFTGSVTIGSPPGGPGRLSSPQQKRENAMRNVFLAGIAFGALTMSAMAADMAPYYKAPPVAQGFNWNGFYLGADVGGAW